MSQVVWGVVLASGQEARLPLALDRMSRLVSAQRLVAVVGPGQGSGVAAAEVIEEPEPRGSALAGLVAAIHVQERDPGAVVVAQTALGPPGLDGRTIRTLQSACRLASRFEEEVLVLGRCSQPLLVAKAAALLGLGRLRIPDAVPWLETYRRVLHAASRSRASKDDLKVALAHLYSRLPRACCGPLVLRGAASHPAASRSDFSGLPFGRAVPLFA